MESALKYSVLQCVIVEGPSEMARSLTRYEQVRTEGVASMILSLNMYACIMQVKS